MALAVGDRSSTIGSSKDADNLTRRPRTAIATARRLRNFSRCLAAIRTFGPRPTRRCDIKARDLMSQIHQAAQKPISENATAKRKTRVPDRLNNWRVCGSDSVKLRYVFPEWRFLDPKDSPVFVKAASHQHEWTDERWTTITCSRKLIPMPPKPTKKNYFQRELDKPNPIFGNRIVAKKNSWLINH